MCGEQAVDDGVTVKDAQEVVEAVDRISEFFSTVQRPSEQFGSLPAEGTVTGISRRDAERVEAEKCARLEPVFGGFLAQGDVRGDGPDEVAVGHGLVEDGFNIVVAFVGDLSAEAAGDFDRKITDQWDGREGIIRHVRRWSIDGGLEELAKTLVGRCRRVGRIERDGIGGGERMDAGLRVESVAGAGEQTRPLVDRIGDDIVGGFGPIDRVDAVGGIPEFDQGREAFGREPAPREVAHGPSVHREGGRREIHGDGGVGDTNLEGAGVGEVEEVGFDEAEGAFEFLRVQSNIDISEEFGELETLHAALPGVGGSERRGEAPDDVDTTLCSSVQFRAQ